ncbi:MAG: ATP-dependent Clp protease adaptor ClpS [Verrucomicrobiota bacterium]
MFTAGVDTPAPITIERSETETERPPIWHVVVLNDPVNLMAYVVMVFRKIFGFDGNKARKHMLEVHEQGRSVLWSGEREQAEAYVYHLQQWKLTAQLVEDDLV